MVRPQNTFTLGLVACVLVMLASGAAARNTATTPDAVGRSMTTMLRRLHQAAEGAACPLNPATTTLNFTEINTACAVPTATGFCDSCSCALFTAFAPALQASGVLNSEALSKAGGAQSAVNQGTQVITSCVTTFLGQFMTNNVPLDGLVALGDCQYPEGQAPACLIERVTALMNATTPVPSPATGSTPTTAGAPATSANGSAFTPEDNEGQAIQDAINGVGATPSAGAGAGATPTPTPAETPASTPTSQVVSPSNNPSIAAAPVAAPVGSTPAPAAEPAPTPAPNAAGSVTPASLSWALAAGLLLMSVLM